MGRGASRGAEGADRGALQESEGGQGEDAAGCAGAAFGLLAAGSWGEGSGPERGSRREWQGQRRREGHPPGGERRGGGGGANPVGRDGSGRARKRGPRFSRGRGCVGRSLGPSEEVGEAGE